MNKTSIGWTDWTWNYPITGCKKIKPECKACYAFTFAEDKRGQKAFPNGFDLTARMHKADQPSRIRTGGLIFCNSMADPGLDDGEFDGDELVRLRAAGLQDTDAMRDAFFDAIERAPQHRYQVLTKRPERVLAYLRTRGRRLPQTVWMGVTIGHHKSLANAEHLKRFRDFGATVLFVSAEPLLEDLAHPAWTLVATGRPAGLDTAGIDWLIAGGESGRHAADLRELQGRFIVRLATKQERKAGALPWMPRADGIDRVRHLRDRCASTGTAFFFKQWGGPRPTSAGRLLDGIEHDGLPCHVAGAMPDGYAERAGNKATAALARASARKGRVSAVNRVNLPLFEGAC